ncbi:MAG: Omp28-related outer membrane protein [Bacteroidota bacterium]
MKQVSVFVLAAALLVSAAGPAAAQAVLKPLAPGGAGAAGDVPVSITGPGGETVLTYLIQDFEGTAFPPAGWTSQGSAPAVWTRTTDASGYGVGAASAFADFYSIQSGSFALITPVFPVAAAGDSVKFDHAYCTFQTENDQLQIAVSTNGGTTWSTLVMLNGGVSGPLVTAPPQTAPFTPQPSQWATKAYPLAAGVNRIRFSAISAYGNSLYVDNIVIGTPFPNDVGAASVDEPRSNIPPGIYTPRVTVKNYGLTTQSFDVDLIIAPGTYASTASVSNLTPGQTQQLTFTTWTPPVGSYTLTAVTQLGTDQNPGNDTLSTFHIVSDLNRAVLLEFCTGTWCPWCPCGDLTADTLLGIYPNLVVLAYHGPAGGTDPYSTFNGNAILSQLGLSAYPTAMFDRQNAPGDFTTWRGFCENRYVNYAPTPVTIAVQSHTFNPSTRQLSVTADLTSNCTLPAQYRVNFVLTEENLVYEQTGNTTCPGSQTWVHKWVVRNMVNGSMGENVNTGVWNAGQTVTKTFTTTLNAAWVPANSHFVIFVYRNDPVLATSEIQNAMVSSVVPPMDVRQTGGLVPSQFEMSQNYPNPFNPATNIRIAVPEQGFVSLKVYDVTGREVRTGVHEVLAPGVYNVQLDASGLASGTYFYTMRAKGFTETRLMTLLR